MAPARPCAILSARPGAGSRREPPRTAVCGVAHYAGPRRSAQTATGPGAHSGTDDGHRLPAVLHAAPAAVLIIDPRHRQVVYANPRRSS